MNRLFRTITLDDEEKETLIREDSSGQNVNFIEQKGTCDRVFIRDLQVPMSIGVSDEERQSPFSVLVNIEIEARPNPNWRDDNIDDVICYAGVTENVERIASGRSYCLLETFAEMLADYCLSLPACRAVTIRVEKPEILKNTKSVGIEITRRSDH